MSTMLLVGTRVNECDKPGAVLYSSATGIPLPIPVFEDQSDAEQFFCWCMNEYGRIRPEVVMDDYAAWVYDRKAVEA